MWEHSAGFIRKASTFILSVSIILWILLNLPLGVNHPGDSYYGRLSGFIAPIFSPAGFGEWQASGALVTGLLAKEVVVSTMSQVYTETVEGPEEAASTTTFLEDLKGIGSGFVQATVQAGQQMIEVLTPGITVFPSEEEPADTALSMALQSHFSPLTAIAFLAFVLLYIPCVGTLGAQIHEFGWKWALFGAGITLIIPWTISVLIYQGGRLLGFE
jgi:ferrous iron transport protein B